MESIFEQIKTYFANATKEQLQNDYESLKDFNEGGMLVSDFLLELKRLDALEMKY